MKKTILIATLLQAFSAQAFEVEINTGPTSTDSGLSGSMQHAAAASSNFGSIFGNYGEKITASHSLGATDKWQPCIREAQEILDAIKPIAEKESGVDLSGIRMAQGIRKVLGRVIADFDHDTKTITASSEFCFQTREFKEFTISHELGHAVAGAKEYVAKDVRDIDLKKAHEREGAADIYGARVASAHLGEKIGVNEFNAMYAINHVQAERMEARLHALKPTVEVGESIILVRSGK